MIYNSKFIRQLANQKINSQKGVSLLELIIYVAIFSTVSAIMVQILLVVLRGRDLTNVRFEVSQNARFATEKIRQTVFDASGISVSGSCPFNTLNATSAIGSATSSIFINSGILQIRDATSTDNITTDKVMATSTGSCLFTIVSGPAPAKDTLQTKIKIMYNNQGRSDLSENKTQEFTASLR
ncbi:prepilin-type N-terminal cleavage/methylation domain-containing protein [Candidatus Wolfebacteria bacterium]|nr:prepilin-type N-terminal cleavage/methylation domain-containing protein [Candidatus Wolfebacteria bacterium]